MFSNDFIAGLLGEWAVGLNTLSVLLRVALSVIFAAVIGCERSTKRHSAGLRTFILVSLSATAAMLIDISLFSGGTFIPAISAAATVGAAMVSGNSIVFSSRNQIKGLTTSAALWACGLMGLQSGRGFTRFQPWRSPRCCAAYPGSPLSKSSLKTAQTILRYTLSLKAPAIFPPL